MKASETILAARDVIIEENKWCKFSVLNKDGQRCARGAFDSTSIEYDKAFGYFIEYDKAFGYLNKAALQMGFTEDFSYDHLTGLRTIINVHPPTDDWLFVHVNNTTNHQTVMEMFDLAAKLAKDDGD